MKQSPNFCWVAKLSKPRGFCLRICNLLCWFLEIIALVWSTGLSQEWQEKTSWAVMCIRNSADVIFSIIKKICTGMLFSRKNQKNPQLFYNWVYFNEIVAYSMMEKINAGSRVQWKCCLKLYNSPLKMCGFILLRTDFLELIRMLFWSVLLENFFHI